MNKLRVAIDCRISNPHQGIGTALLALAKALSRSEDTGQEYTFVISGEIQDWLSPHVFGPCRIKALPVSKMAELKKSLRNVAPLRALWNKTRSRQLRVPASDGYVESEGFDVVHFPTQAAYLTSVPSIYQPWDLQHLHYPEFFSKIDLTLREKLYPAFCDQAECVCVQTEWTRQDVIAQYGLAPEKVTVIPWGSVFDAYARPSAEQKAAASRKFALPAQFFTYPAVTWPHKNHEDILRAVHLLKTRHRRRVEVFFTGASTNFRQKLDELANELGVAEQLHYLGFVTAEELQSIFSAATAMVFASKFEGFGLPILEAFHARLPVLSSNATVLPEVAQNGALYFSPGCPGELAELMLKMLDNADLRESLAERGSAVLKGFSMDDTARSFQRLYARVSRRTARRAGGPDPRHDDPQQPEARPAGRHV
jgi:glycosyltransferase involved in cell wall biosynthesis